MLTPGFLRCGRYRAQASLARRQERLQIEAIGEEQPAELFARYSRSMLDSSRRAARVVPGTLPVLHGRLVYVIRILV